MDDSIESYSQRACSYIAVIRRITRMCLYYVVDFVFDNEQNPQHVAPATYRQSSEPADAYIA